MDAEVLEGLQGQLNMERMNAQKYFYISSVMSNMGYNGFAKWFMKQGQGELGHAKLIEDFLTSKRVQPQYRALGGVSVEGGVVGLTQEAFRTEVGTTASLSTLYQLAEDNGEPQVCAFLAPLLVEQVEEETVSADLMDLVARTDEKGWTVLDWRYEDK